MENAGTRQAHYNGKLTQHCGPDEALPRMGDSEGMSMLKTEYRRWATRVRLIGAIAGALLISTLFLYSRYTDQCPTVPDEKVKREYPLNIHGRIVYLNATERGTLNVLQGTTVACILSFILLVRSRPSK